MSEDERKRLKGKRPDSRPSCHPDTRKTRNSPSPSDVPFTLRPDTRREVPFRTSNFGTGDPPRFRRKTQSHPGPPPTDLQDTCRSDGRECPSTHERSSPYETFICRSGTNLWRSLPLECGGPPFHSSSPPPP